MVEAQQKSVGPDLFGKLDEYQLITKLQSALFGAVYESRGKRTGEDLAIKVLHKSELKKVPDGAHDLCETPLSELQWEAEMAGHEHLLALREAFEDQYCHYVVTELARGGDLLEALKRKSQGFAERDAQYMVRHCVSGLEHLHRQSVVLQDFSLENLLLCVNPDGTFCVKICDPGQAQRFLRDAAGAEEMLEFGGLVGKSFRPPELYQKVQYYGTKVDSWCLGWSCFYLLTAQSLFQSADPSENDPDWEFFSTEGPKAQWLGDKNWKASAMAANFVFSHLRLQPHTRLASRDALQHAWLADSGYRMLADQEFVLRDRKMRQRMNDSRARVGNVRERVCGRPFTRASSPVLRPATSAARLPGRSRPMYVPRHAYASPRNFRQRSPQRYLSPWAPRKPAEHQVPSPKLAPTMRREAPAVPLAKDGGGSALRRGSPGQSRFTPLARSVSPPASVFRMGVVAGSPRLDNRVVTGAVWRTASPLGGLVRR